MDAEQLLELENFAKLPGFTKKDIATSLGLDYDAFIELLISDSDIRNAYNKGRLTWDATFNAKVDQLSNQGSGPAQSLIYKMKNDAKFQELRDTYK